MSRKSARRKAEEGRGADQALLVQRLGRLGLRAVRQVVLHRNRTVMVSYAKGVLRIHRGYAYAPDRVLQAVVTFLSSRISRAERRRAEATLLAFPVEQYAPPAQRRRLATTPRDRKVLTALRNAHDRLNRRHFSGALSDIPIRLSARMRSQLGEVVLEERTHRPVEIALSRRHLLRDGWEEIERTLLHEMIHQWQAESGLPVNHGAAFRRKARAVGVEPAARRDVRGIPVFDGFSVTED